ncbi:hypothetical protein [Sulfurimonas sp.]|uniref:hypothetical protein n=1 Tax=Sulfurimonas sp. TaxID=2022749 RepID=UPI0025CF0FAE|nr:hypothetical protein [Sulfurimonas sp.]
MIKLLLTFFLFSSLAIAENLAVGSDDILMRKAVSFIDPKLFTKDRVFLETILSPKKDFYMESGSVDSVKIIKTLKNRGLINLFFKQPSEINLSFKTDGTTILFMKIMSDSLRNIGYYKYITKESSLKDKDFLWKISLTSEYATDPVLLSSELEKNNCFITDIIRESATDWTYVVDMRDAKIDTKKLIDGEGVALKRSLYAYWLDVSGIKELEIESSDRNSWFPYISYYDKNLQLLRVVREDEKKRKVSFNIEKDVYYIKISDIYTLKNIKDSLVLTSRGEK